MDSGVRLASLHVMQSTEIHPGDIIAGKYRVRAILGRNHGLLVDAFHTEFDQRGEEEPDDDGALAVHRCSIS